MYLLFKLAMRNLLRYKRQGFLTGMAMFLSSMLIVVIGAYNRASESVQVESVIDSFLGHVQIFADQRNGMNVSAIDYQNDYDFINSGAEIEKVLEDDPRIKSYLKKAVLWVLLLHEETSFGVVSAGYDPDMGRKVFPMVQTVRGDYFSSTEPTLMMTSPLAEAMGVEIGTEITTLVADPDGSINALNVRFTGVAAGSSYQDWGVWIDGKSIEYLLNLEQNQAVAYVLRLSDPNEAEGVKADLNLEFKRLGLKVSAFAWGEMGSIFLGFQAISQVFGTVSILIVLAATAAVVTNATLMSVFERTREIGTIGALGAKGHQILGLFIFEALILGLVSAGLGVLGGASIAEWLSRLGIPALNDSMRYSYGGDRIYLIPAFRDWILAFGAVNLLCLASALYPAYRAVAMRPVEALRYV